MVRNLNFWLKMSEVDFADAETSEINVADCDTSNFSFADGEKSKIILLMVRLLM